MQTRYHIQLNNRRTTISVDTVLSELLAFKLGVDPGEKEAHSRVRGWLESTIKEQLGDNLPSHSRVSQYARRFVIEAVADSELMSKVWNSRIK